MGHYSLFNYLLFSKSFWKICKNSLIKNTLGNYITTVWNHPTLWLLLHGPRFCFPLPLWCRKGFSFLLVTGCFTTVKRFPYPAHIYLNSSFIKTSYLNTFVCVPSLCQDHDWHRYSKLQGVRKTTMVRALGCSNQANSIVGLIDVTH